MSSAQRYSCSKVITSHKKKFKNSKQYNETRIYRSFPGFNHSKHQNHAIQQNIFYKTSTLSRKIDSEADLRRRERDEPWLARIGWCKVEFSNSHAQIIRSNHGVTRRNRLLVVSFTVTTPRLRFFYKDARAAPVSVLYFLFRPPQ